MKHKKILKKIRLGRKKDAQSVLPDRITSDNLADHREDVLGSARKYIYPLRHSKHSLVKISLSLFISAIVIFFAYCGLALYKFKSDSGFLYQVTKVIPFPLARIGSDFVSYESYLFEVRRYTHYYKTQQSVDFNSDAGKQQLTEFRKRAMDKVINDTYVSQLAKEKGIKVSDKEVNDAIAIYRSQNRIGSSDKEFETVLREFWDWSINDFKRSLRQKLLTEKVLAALDTEALAKAQKALSQLNSGKDFSILARQVSEDPATRNNGGDFGFDIDKNNRDIAPQTVDTLFKLKPGQVSGIVNVGYGLEILKNRGVKDGKIKASHIIFNFKDINQFLGTVKDQHKTRTYVSF